MAADNDKYEKITVEEFCEINKKFGGFIRLLYCNYEEEFVICNVCNYSYAIFPLYTYKNSEGNEQMGLFVSKEFVRKLYRDDSQIAMVAQLDEKTLMKISFDLCDQNLEVFEKLQAMRDIEGPSQEIDFELEKRMMLVAKRHYQTRLSRVEKEERKSKSTAILLSIFLGFLGIDRFYLGHYEIGIVKLFTLGAYGILWLLDIIGIAIGMVEPADGKGYAERKKSKTKGEPDLK